MSSAPERDGRPLVYGLRIGVWYATLFVAGSMAIVTLTYLLASASLAQRDRQIIDSKLGVYATAYERGGLDALAATVQAEQRTAPERLFVRVVDRGAEAIVLSQPEGWNLAALETGSHPAGATARSCRWGRAPRRATICSRASGRRSGS